MCDPSPTDWDEYWRNCAPLRSSETAEAFRQVGKTEFGLPVAGNHLDLIVSAIASALWIGPDDHLVDLGCGNGVVTSRLCVRVSSIEAVDSSEPLIRSARDHFAAPNCRYHVADVEDFVAGMPSEISKVYAYEVAQHLSSERITGLLKALKRRSNSDFRFFLGSIPDEDKLEAFYDTPDRRRFYEEGLISGRAHLGRWWRKHEIMGLSKKVGLRCEILPQNTTLYTARYRFDALFIK